MTKVKTDIPEVRFISVDLVPAPRCEECGSEMNTASASHWSCRQKECSLYLHHVHTGVYGIYEGDDEDV